MQFRIADTFTDSLAKLTGDEQKAVKTTAFDLQVDPAPLVSHIFGDFRPTSATTGGREGQNPVATAS